MFLYKSNSDNGLDYKIYSYTNEYIQKHHIKLSKNYYFYIFDYVKTKINLPNSFYNQDNIENNTWNLSLKYVDTTKYNIMNDSVKFNFGSYKYDKNDTNIVVKAIGHCQTTNLYGQAHVVTKKNYENLYNKTFYIGQKILKSSKNNINEELNIFVVRNLNTRELHFYCILCLNDVNVNINRKFSKCSYKEIDISVLGEKLKNFIDYMNYINFDYGRIELINDINLGWCIIDINNSPGQGPITDLAFEKVSQLFLKSIL